MTSYEVVYKRFLNKLRDFNLAELDDATVESMLNDWLHSSIVRTRTSTDLSKRNEEEEFFENDLTDLDVELLALGMLLSWLEPYLNSSELTLQFIGGKEEKYFSQSKHLEELQDRHSKIIQEMHRLYTYNTYLNNKYFK